MLNVNQSTGARRDGLGRVVTVCPVMRQMANAFGNMEGAPDAGVDEGLCELLW